MDRVRRNLGAHLMHSHCIAKKYKAVKSHELPKFTSYHSVSSSGIVNTYFILCISAQPLLLSIIAFLTNLLSFSLCYLSKHFFFKSEFECICFCVGFSQPEEFWIKSSGISRQSKAYTKKLHWAFHLGIRWKKMILRVYITYLGRMLISCYLFPWSRGEF